MLQIRPLAFFRQTDNYPPDVAALSKKMVQATLEIYKNTLWASDCWDWDLPCGHLWKPNRTPPHSSEWMCMVAWHLRLVDIAVNSWHGIASLAEELSSQRIIFQASSGCGHRNRSGRMSCGRHLWRTGGGLCKCEVWQDQVLQRMDDVNYANDSGTTANIIQIIPKCKSQFIEFDVTPDDLTFYYYLNCVLVGKVSNTAEFWLVGCHDCPMYCDIYALRTL